MSPGDVAFLTLAANPMGGLLVAIPFGVLQLHYSGWVAVLTGTPLAYLQVIAVDAAWSLLCRSEWWRHTLERRRTPRTERLLASRGGFWISFLLAPLIGPWLVMALMRSVRVPQRRVALPILLALLCTASALAIACSLMPSVFGRAA
jgi:hypothetical protein